MHLMEAAVRGARLLAAKATDRAVPFHVSVFPTARCNLRCVYCSSPHETYVELSTSEWCAIFNELRALGTERLAFLGGEPLVRKDLDALVAHAKRVGLTCTLTTNGAFVADRPEVVRQLDTLVVSLDGDAQAHDRHRGIGSHADAIRGIRAAQAWGVPVKINTVLSRENADGLRGLLAFCAEQHLPVTINLMRSEPNGLWHEAASHRLADDEVRRLVDTVLEARRTNPWVVFSAATYRVTRQWPDFSRDRLTVAEVGDRFPGPRCSAGRFHVAIRADGAVYPCPTVFGQVPAVNARDAGVARAVEVARHHGCATCFSPCMVEHNALFALDPVVVAGLLRVYLARRLA
jgi:MoaA/NifB/PqqE/SkfB family radical SAM enzyme